MKLKLLTSTFILAFGFTQFASASNSIFVSGKKAERIYNALIATGAKDSNRLIEVTTIYCSIVSSRGTAPYSVCDLQGTEAYNRGDYVGGDQTQELISSLRAVRIRVGKPVKEDDAVVRVLETGKVSCDNQDRVVRDDSEQSGRIVNEYTCTINKS